MAEDFMMYFFKGIPKWICPFHKFMTVIHGYAFVTAGQIIYFHSKIDKYNISQIEVICSNVVPNERSLINPLRLSFMIV